MNVFWKTPRFQKLQATWNAKLKESGFVDIEEGIDHGGGGYTTGHRVLDAANASLRDREAIIEYYRRAEQFLYEHTFPTKRSRRIWELHSEGRPVRSIAVDVGCGRTTVQYFIDKYRRKAGLTRWKR